MTFNPFCKHIAIHGLLCDNMFFNKNLHIKNKSQNIVEFGIYAHDCDVIYGIGGFFLAFLSIN